MTSSIDRPINKNEAARLIGRTPQWLANLERRGYITRLERGAYDPVSVVAGFTNFLIEEKKASSISSAIARHTEAKAQLVEARVAREAGTLAPVSVITSYLHDTLGFLFSQFAAVPARFTRDLAERRRLEDLINAVRLEIVTHFKKSQDEHFNTEQKRKVGR